ncbi:MAG: hypothetical protein OHK0022_01800 [Roseiflexaceae bacterium]
MLFDLDNTLYPASRNVMQIFDRRITEYVQKLLGVDAESAARLREEYFQAYGTTLRGLQQYHQVDAEDYLQYVHDMEVQSFLALDAELDRLLGLVHARKVIFTNSPVEHSRRVLNALGISQHFEQIFDIRFCQFQPKPAPEVYQLVLDALGVPGNEALFIEDTARNLAPARELGLTTILITPQSDARTAAQADYLASDILAAIQIVLQLEARRQEARG